MALNLLDENNTYFQKNEEKEDYANLEITDKEEF